MHRCDLMSAERLCCGDVLPFGTGYRCRLHFPLVTKSGGPTDRSSWPKQVEEELVQQVTRELLNSRARHAVLFNAVVVADLDIVACTVAGLTIDKCSFGAHVSFTELEVVGNLAISHSVFERSLRLEECTIRDVTSFQHSKVSGEAILVGNVFYHDAHFGDSEFNDVFSLERSIFSRYASFRDCSFRSYSILRHVEFQGYFNCKRAVFYRESIFDYSSFRAVTTFDSAIFRDDLSLAGCKFHRAPTFQSSEFRGWLSATDACFLDLKSVEAYTAYRTLRQIFSQKDAKREEMAMFALEQRALTHCEKNLIIAMFGKSYGWLSEYGTNPVRSLVFLSLVSLGAFCAYVWIATTSNPNLLDPTSIAASHFFKQVFSPFSVWSKENEPTWAAQNLLVLQLSSSIHSVLTLLALGFLSLSLHWRFRKI